MKTLLHLCKKDFGYVKPWIFGVWFTLAAGTVLPALIPATGAPMPWAAIREWIPALLIFLTSTRIIHCDPFTSTTAFIVTRPVRAIVLLGGKLAFIACVLILPAALLALIYPTLMGFELAASEHLLLFLEKALYFAIFAAAAVLVSVLTRRVGTMTLLSAVVLIVIGSMVRSAFGRPGELFGRTLESQHMHASAWFIIQVFLMIAATAIGMSRAAKCRWQVTAAMFILAAGAFIGIGKGWKWNFVDELSQDVRTAVIVSDHAEVQWTDAPVFYSHSKSINNIDYSLVTRQGRVTGLKDGWSGKLVKFQSEARFKDGTVLKSVGVSNNGSFDDPTPVILPQLGIDIAGKQFMRNFVRDLSWPLFEFEKSRLHEISNRRASIRGTGTFQLNQPVILAELPAKAGASAVIERFRCKIDSLTSFDDQIYLHLSVSGVPLTSLGDRAWEMGRAELLLVNPDTKEFTRTFGSGGDGIRAGNSNVKETFWIQQEVGLTHWSSPIEFLKNARLYIIGRRYGGNITLPYEIPEMLLDEKR